jgi:acetyl esterase/lipase
MQDARTTTTQPVSTASPPVARQRRGWRRILTSAARGALALVFVVCLLLTVTPTGRAGVRAALLLPALLTGAEPPMLVVAGDPIRHTQRTIASQDGLVYLDIYAPTTPTPPVPGARQGLLLISGVGDNRGVPQFVNLAQSLARTGVVAMTMTTDTLMGYTLVPATVDAVVQAALALQHTPGVDARHVGIVGLSAGGSLGMMAAADPRIRDTLGFALSFGGYYDATSLLRDMGRRALEADGRLVAWQPDPVPIQALANTIALTLPGPDQSLLYSGFNALNGLSLSPADQARLSPAGQAAYHLLVGDQPDRVAANLAALPPEGHALLASLSPSSVVGQIHAPVYLLHDQSDIYVPFTESRDFAAALTRLGHPHEFVEFSIFQHVEVKSGQGIGQTIHDGWSLYRILVATLGAVA